MPGAAAGQCAAQQLAGHRQPVALVFAKRHQGAKKSVRLWHDDHAGVDGWLAVLVHQQAGFHRLALVVGDAHLALGDAAGRKIQHEGRMVFQRNANAARIGAKAPVAAAPRRDHGARLDVDEMQ